MRALGRALRLLTLGRALRLRECVTHTRPGALAPRRRRAQVAAFLGATGSAYCTGRGVFLRASAAEPLPPLAAPAHGATLFVVLPSLSLSTPAVFRALAADEYASLSDAPPAELRAAVVAAPDEAIAASCVNDLGAPAMHVSPQLAAVHAALVGRDGVRAALLSGAGPCLYALGEPPDDQTPAAFAASLASECEAACGARVRVWPVQLAAGDDGSSGGWYAIPDDAAAAVGCSGRERAM
jgi:4-diphosphocytidyl-2C-methyl-D-erythritol kinase